MSKAKVKKIPEVPKLTPKEKFDLKQQRRQNQPKALEAAARARNKKAKIAAHNKAASLSHALKDSVVAKDDYPPSSFRDE